MVRRDSRFAYPIRRSPHHRVIVTVGGRSYPGCGTIGDGYEIAGPHPGPRDRRNPAGIVPIPVNARDWVADLRGVTLPDVTASIHVPGGGLFQSRARGRTLRPLRADRPGDPRREPIRGWGQRSPPAHLASGPAPRRLARGAGPGDPGIEPSRPTGIDLPPAPVAAAPAGRTHGRGREYPRDRMGPDLSPMRLPFRQATRSLSTASSFRAASQRPSLRNRLFA